VLRMMWWDAMRCVVRMTRLWVVKGVFGHDGNAYSPAERRLSMCRTSFVNRSESSTGSKSSNASSEGSSVQPSMGIPLADGAPHVIIRGSVDREIAEV
jgi:hypothetical protein